MNLLGIIPARYGSTRLEGKPLVDIQGKPMIQRVYEQASKALETVYVATDDERIVEVVKGFSGNVVMTSPHHTTGTNRCLEAFNKIIEETQKTYQAIINVQGDEPLLVPTQLTELANCFLDESTELATLVSPVTRLDDLYNESECFVVFDKQYNAMYFSRSVVPHIHGTHKHKWTEKHTFYKHVGLYAYSPKALRDFSEMAQTDLEMMESLEQNRWLENGRKLRVAITKHDSIPVDTIDDLKRVRQIVKEQEG